MLQCQWLHLEGTFNKQNIYGRAAIPKPLVTHINAKCRLECCHAHKAWSIDKWRKEIWSHESTFTHFPTTGRERVSFKMFGGHPYKRVIVIISIQQSAMEMDLSRYGQPRRGRFAQLIVILKGRITGEKYKNVLANQVHPMMKICFLQEVEFSRMIMHISKPRDWSNHGLMNIRMN
ncbi:DDE_3 domain-containing protein [Trichonephila clavipes]|nr:DDE_3 domain-containing protein [Trichonephila clavipes]